jgi:hypothetical protein
MNNTRNGLPSFRQVLQDLAALCTLGQFLWDHLAK